MLSALLMLGVSASFEVAVNRLIRITEAEMIVLLCGINRHTDAANPFRHLDEPALDPAAQRLPPDGERFPARAQIDELCRDMLDCGR